MTFYFRILRESLTIFLGERRRLLRKLSEKEEDIGALKEAKIEIKEEWVQDEEEAKDLWDFIRESNSESEETTKDDLEKLQKAYNELYAENEMLVCLAMVWPKSSF